MDALQAKMQAFQGQICKDHKDVTTIEDAETK